MKSVIFIVLAFVGCSTATVLDEPITNIVTVRTQIGSCEKPGYRTDLKGVCHSSVPYAALDFLVKDYFASDDTLKRSTQFTSCVDGVRALRLITERDAVWVAYKAKIVKICCTGPDPNLCHEIIKVP